MSLLSNIKKSDNQEVEQDVIYKGGNGPLPTGAYPATIKLAMLKESQAGALALELHMEIQGKTVRETIYFTNRQQETFYTKNGKTFPLPGYTTVNDISLVTTGVYIEDQDSEEKTVELYDFDAKTEVPKQVNCVTSMHGKTFIAGLYEEQTFKQAKNEATGKWEDTDELRQSNTINKVFNEDGFTVQELIAEADDPSFINDWKENYDGQLIDRTKGKKPKAAKPGLTKPGAGATKPKGSLFGKKK